MVKSLSKKVIAIFLSVCILISTMALSIPVVSAVDNKNQSSTSYISSLHIATTADDRNAKGSPYTYIDKNLDDNSYVYLGYSLTNDFTEAITGIIFSKEIQNTLTYNGRNYNLLDSVNFNKDKGQEDLYLYYTKEQDPYGTTEYLTNLDVVGTSNSSLDGKEYKTVVRVETKFPQNLNAAYDAFDKRPYLYLGYQSQMSPNDTYQKLGNGDLDSKVKSVNGIDYYNFDADVSKNDFLIKALSQQYSGNSAVESWAQILYSMMSVKKEGSGYQNRIEGSSFDDVFGKGQYVDLVSALTNGSGTENSQYNRGLLIQSTGLKQTSNIDDVREEMVNLFTHLVHQHDYNLHNMDDPNEIGKYLVKQDLFDNFQSSSDIIYTLCRVADDKAKPNHLTSASVIGMIFYNFNLVPIVEDGSNLGNDTLNYDDVYTNNVINNSSFKIDKNDTGAAVNSSKSFANSVSSSTTNSHANTSGQTYSVTEGMSFSGKAPFIKVNTTINLSSSQAFTFSETNTVTDAITQSETKTDGLSYTIPPYSIAAVNCISSDETRTQSYDCPIALTYDVAFVASGAELGSSNGFATSFAYKSDYYATFGGKGTSAVEVLNNLYKTNGSDTSNFAIKCTGEQNFSKYSSDEWNKILNKAILSNEFSSTTSDTIKFITSKQPMSFLGGQFESDVSAVSYTFDKYYALYPIDKIKIYKTNPASSAQTLVQHIDLKSEGSYRLQDYYNTISAFDEHNSSWTNWDSTQGYWALITDDPSTGEEQIIRITSDPVSDSIVSAYRDSKTGLIYITPIKNGRSYIRYVINENVFQYYPNVPGDAAEFSTLNLKYVSNNDITAKGTIEINTSNIYHDYDENGFCKSCGAYQPANLNSNGLYEISNAGQLFWFASLVNGDKTHAEFDEKNQTAKAVLMCNINLDNREWKPINGFNGIFDGQDKTVSGLKVTQTSSYSGLFGSCSGEIKNLTVKGDITISSDGKCIGGLVGYANGAKISDVVSYVNISNTAGSLTHIGGIIGDIGNSETSVDSCMYNGTINMINSEDCIGGVVGYTNGGGRINNCANLGTVTSSTSGAFIGGILGYVNNSNVKVTNCYNYGKVNNANNNHCGAIIGWARNYGKVINNYYLDGSSSLAFGSDSKSGAIGVSNSADEFKSGKVSYLLNNSVTDGSQVWYQNIDNDKPIDNYPMFDGGTVYYLSYIDTYSNTYSEKPAESDEFNKDDDGNLIISTYDDLVKLSELIISDYDVYGSQNYILTNNIKASDNSEWKQGIGSIADSKPFNGTFDGNGYCIIGLNVNSSKYGGLFEIIGENGFVKNLFVFDCDFKSSSKNSGGIASMNNGTIDHCISGVNLSTGTIHIENNTINASSLNSSIKGEISGGIVGINNGNIIGCRNASVVSGTQCGGIAGENTSKIYGCANNGSIGTSTSSISGGLAGKNNGKIESSYNSENVNGSSENTKGSIAGINGFDSTAKANVKNVFYRTSSTLNAVGTNSYVTPDNTNTGMASSSDFKSNSFTDKLNKISDNSVIWIRNSMLNRGYPTIQCNFFKYYVKSTGDNITVSGNMHKDANIQYEPCSEESTEYNLLCSELDKNKILKMYTLNITDKDGNYIPAEIWCQGNFEISVPINSENVELAGIDADGKITYYKPNSIKDGTAVFTVAYPMSFAIIESAKDNKLSNDNTIIKTLSDNTTIQTGSKTSSALLIIEIFSVILIFALKRRNKIG